MASTVYFSRTITPEKVLELFDKLGAGLEGRVAVKVHSGEKGNQNFLHPEFWRPVIEAVGGTVVGISSVWVAEVSVGSVVRLLFFVSSTVIRSQPENRRVSSMTSERKSAIGRFIKTTP